MCWRKGVWLSLENPAPSKVVSFSWQLLWDRIPTRMNLVKRNALDPNICINCRPFLRCQVSSDIWLKVLTWLDLSFITPHNLFVHLECWSVEARDRRIRKGLWLIWHVVIWVIWRTRNGRKLRCCHGIGAWQDWRSQLVYFMSGFGIRGIVWSDNVGRGVFSHFGVILFCSCCFRLSSVLLNFVAGLVLVVFSFLGVLSSWCYVICSGVDVCIFAASFVLLFLLSLLLLSGGVFY